MIIFGTRAKTKDLDAGQFFCPHCQEMRQYVRKQARPYFTLYFLPVFPVGKGSEFVECQTCHLAFEPGVLSMKAPERKADLATQINRIKTRLESGTPVEYVTRDLTGAGVEWDVARAMVDAQIGPARNVCDVCGLAYASTVTTCAECHGSLRKTAG
jgi:transcription elongation factor Elf1